MLDASGIIHIKDNQFLIAEDELDHLRVFEFNEGSKTFSDSGIELNLGEEESDFESLAYDSKTDTFFCTGSFGHKNTQRLVSFKMVNNKLKDVQEIEVDPISIIDDNVDIESLSVFKSRLIMGYRKPKRGQKALALFVDPSTQEKLLMAFDLAGRSFRDMVQIDEENYLILAGPEKGKEYEKLPAKVVWWNGDILNPKLKMLNIDLKGVRAEGIAVRATNTHIGIFIGTDESKIANSESFRLLYVDSGNLDNLFENGHKTIELSVILN